MILSRICGDALSKPGLLLSDAARGTHTRNSLARLIFVLHFSVVGVVGSTSVEARDRPGTPVETEIWPCPGPGGRIDVCVRWTNTSGMVLTPLGMRRELVGFEVEMLKNGNKYGPSVSCLAPEESACWNPAFKGYYTTPNQSPNSTINKVGFKILDADPNTKYCFRLRARRQSDDVVSANWSGTTCVTTGEHPGPGCMLDGVLRKDIAERDCAEAQRTGCIAHRLTPEERSKCSEENRKAGPACVVKGAVRHDITKADCKEAQETGCIRHLLSDKQYEACLRANKPQPSNPKRSDAVCQAFGKRMVAMQKEASKLTCAFMTGASWHDRADYWERQCKSGDTRMELNETSLKRQLDKCRAGAGGSVH
jgi:hypothetical protein